MHPTRRINVLDLRHELVTMPFFRPTEVVVGNMLARMEVQRIGFRAYQVELPRLRFHFVPLQDVLALFYTLAFEMPGLDELAEIDRLASTAILVGETHAITRHLRGI